MKIFELRLKLILSLLNKFLPLLTLILSLSMKNNFAQNESLSPYCQRKLSEIENQKEMRSQSLGAKSRQNSECVRIHGRYLIYSLGNTDRDRMNANLFYERLNTCEFDVGLIQAEIDEKTFSINKMEREFNLTCLKK